MEEWSNNAAYGYMIAGAKEIGLSDEDIRNLRKAMYLVMDLYTVEEAAKIYIKSEY